MVEISYMSNLEEQQYLNLIQKIMREGVMEEGRNGNTLSVFGELMRFSLNDRKIPFLTTKKLAWKMALKELLWFIRGETNNTTLNEQGVHIWDANSTRNFLDDRGLITREEGDLGPIYGYQWRHFNASYQNCHTSYSGQGIDQLQYIINNLKSEDPIKRTSRRLLMTAWNPCQIDEMALPPCHVMVQFQVTLGNKLSCMLFQRSGDIGLGVPFNIASYSMLTHLLAHHCGLEAHEFIYTLGNAHIYDDHIEALSQQVQREPLEFPRLSINQIYENINDYKVEDFVVEDYQCHSSIFMPMRA
jgi:thymidylate synthase